MKSYEQKLIFFGLYSLVVSAILGIVAVLLAGELPTPEQTSAWTETINSSAYRTRLTWDFDHHAGTDHDQSV